MQKILVSSCLLGNRVRYNDLHAKPNSDTLDRWIGEGRVIAVCPEIAAGFSVPRAAAEIRGGSGLDVLNGVADVVTQGESNLTRQFVFGARQALEAARLHDIRIAVLTDGSPSCGSTYIYDGRFSGAMLSGVTGVTTALLRSEGLEVFSQQQIVEAAQRLLELESRCVASRKEIPPAPKSLPRGGSDQGS